MHLSCLVSFCPCDKLSSILFSCAKMIHVKRAGFLSLKFMIIHGCHATINYDSNEINALGIMVCHQLERKFAV